MRANLGCTFGSNLKKQSVNKWHQQRIALVGQYCADKFRSIGSTKHTIGTQSREQQRVILGVLGVDIEFYYGIFGIKRIVLFHISYCHPIGLPIIIGNIPLIFANKLIGTQGSHKHIISVLHLIYFVVTRKSSKARYLPFKYSSIITIDIAVNSFQRHRVAHTKGIHSAHRCASCRLYESISLFLANSQTQTLGGKHYHLLFVEQSITECLFTEFQKLYVTFVTQLGIALCTLNNIIGYATVIYHTLVVTC